MKDFEDTFHDFHNVSSGSYATQGENRLCINVSALIKCERRSFGGYTSIDSKLRVTMAQLTEGANKAESSPQRKCFIE